MINTIHVKLFDNLEIGDDYPTIVMGVLNLSPESFYSGSVYTTKKEIKAAVDKMLEFGVKVFDVGGRSTAPWSKKITVKEEISRIIPVTEYLCQILPPDAILSIDTQFKEVADKVYEIISDQNKKMILNDVSCFKTDPTLMDFVIETQVPTIIMASKKIPGDALEMSEIIEIFRNTLTILEDRGYDINKVVLDPGIGHWVEEKTFEYDLKIINNLSNLRSLHRPILVAISRKSFIGQVLNLPNPNDRLNGTLSATAIAIYNGAHIIRTHDISQQLFEITKIAEELRRNK